MECVGTAAREIVNRLAADRVLLLKSLDGLTTAQFHCHPTTGWSIAEVLEHLAIAHELSNGVVDHLETKARAAGTLADAGVSVIDDLSREKVVNRADRVTAPERLVPVSGMPAAESLARLESARAALLARLPELLQWDLRGVKTRHPALGTVTGYQWLLFMAYHEARHAGQILEIRSGMPSEAEGCAAG